MNLFESATIGNCKLENRIIRSATFEGMCDGDGFPHEEYKLHYENLARHQIGGIITGFAYISKEGKAMQPGQAGIENPEKVPYFREVTDRVHQQGGRIFLQLAHAGRQSSKVVTGRQLRSSSSKRSPYFREKPRAMAQYEIRSVVKQFGEAASRAKEAGFDGVQVHAAHGYLINQFITPAINKRKDEYGIDKLERIGKKFLMQVLKAVRKECGKEFPLLVKISAGDDYFHDFSKQQFINLVMFLDAQGVDAIEVSYGTMDYALSIFRGDFPEDLILQHNPFYSFVTPAGKQLASRIYFPYYRFRMKPFKPHYNLDYASLAKQFTAIPVISVGGFRTRAEMEAALESRKADFVSLSRPFLAEPDLVSKLKQHGAYRSKCTSCNYCAIMCDSMFPTKCYKN